MNVKAACLMGASILALASPLHADAAPTVEGTWQVYDDRNGQPNGVVRMLLQDGQLMGVVERLRPGVPPGATCGKCSPPQKDKPILGLVIAWGLKRDGDSWSGGTILDPDSGSTYRCTMRLKAPDALEVRGFIGISLFGRTQHWVRTTL